MNHSTPRETGRSHGDRTLRGLRQIASARIFTQLVTWGLTAVTIHLLQPSDYGLIATAGIFTSFALLLLDGGLSDVLVAQRELPVQVQGAAATAVLVISFGLGAIIFLAAPLASRFFHAPALRLVIEVTAFYLPLVSLDVAPLAVLSKRMEYDRIALAQTLSSVLNGVSTLCLAYG
jgi:teichuronic acid exporter